MSKNDKEIGKDYIIIYRDTTNSSIEYAFTDLNSKSYSERL